MILAAAGYIFLFLFANTLTMEGSSAFAAKAEHALFAAYFLWIVLFGSDYLEIRERLKFDKIRFPFIRGFMAVVFNLVIFIIILCICGSICNNF